MRNVEASVRQSYETLCRTLREMGSVVVAFSGGIDSTLVLKVAHDLLGENATAVTAVSPTLPARELDDVRRLSAEIGARLKIVETDQLQLEEFVRNDASRCYHCKMDLSELLRRVQDEVHAAAIVDGVQVDDLGDDRPGLVAGKEWGVRSPLVEAGLGKAEVRVLARALGLSNWDKPAAACLSSRVPRGVMITHGALSRIERAEDLLLREGFTQVRVRDYEDLARIETVEAEWELWDDAARRQRVIEGLKGIGYQFVTVDLEGYRSGGRPVA